jgi:hypothetical protein
MKWFAGYRTFLPAKVWLAPVGAPALAQVAFSVNQVTDFDPKMLLPAC